MVDVPCSEIPQGGAKGTVLAQGGRFGGWSLCTGRIPRVTIEVKQAS
jgi:hypothetical protein